MYTAEIENQYGEKLCLTDSKLYTIYQIDGLDPPTANINTVSVATFDGSRFNSSRMNERNIVIYMTVEGNCENNRINLYKYAKSKHFIRFYYKNDSRNVYIDGYVESVSIQIFEMKQTVQISIICPDPYFKSVTEDIVDFSSIENLFHFSFAYEESGEPFSFIDNEATSSIINEGDVENGVVIELKASGQVVNPRIFNETTNTYFMLSITMQEGDSIIINTNKGQKGVFIYEDGIQRNIINCMQRGSSWFQLAVGDNLFSYSAESYVENLSCTFTRTNAYEGV